MHFPYNEGAPFLTEYNRWREHRDDTPAVMTLLDWDHSSLGSSPQARLQGRDAVGPSIAEPEMLKWPSRYWRWLRLRRSEGQRRRRRGMRPSPFHPPSVTTTTKTSVIQHKYDPVRGRCNHLPSLPHRSNNYSFDLLTLGISCIPRRPLSGLDPKPGVHKARIPSPATLPTQLATSYSNYTRPVNGQYTSISSHSVDRDISLTIPK